jgi:uncharacterized damage-inducible protein DinB
MRHQFLIDTYQTELLKVLSVWSMFKPEDLPFRPHPTDPRGRSVHEHMVHQCVSEDFWFRTILGIDVGIPPLPAEETRLEFIRRYTSSSTARLTILGVKSEAWWEEEVQFFEVMRSRAWVMVGRIAHTAHHRGQQTAILRMLNRDAHSTYGPTADTGGLMQDNAPVIYAYRDLESLLDGEALGGRKAKLPGPKGRAVTERGQAGSDVSI